MPAPDKIKELVERFHEQQATYKEGNYNETQVRGEFINPFFKELGWDIDNKKGYHENYREVILEYKQSSKSGTKSPDYCFRIGGQKKFFVEAKKPKIYLKEEKDPAMQVRRYGWSAKLPISILTDFEEFAVYDTRIKPQKDDEPATARIKYITYEHYLENWDYLRNNFSKEAVMKGRFDIYADQEKSNLVSQPVDEEFLKEIEGFRRLLAKSIIANKNLNVRDLNYCVQMTIDRIIFLRICEDRGIEGSEQLKNLLQKQGIYKELLKSFQSADDRYNSGLFHFKEEKGRYGSVDRISKTLDIDDKTLKEIIAKLYYPNPYEFSQMPAEILGSVYERFLGNTITISKSGSRIKIEEKPEVKKAGGVYYTPDYIVHAIVKNTLGKWLEGKKPSQVKKLKVLDPACGSGSFLIVAYQHLLDWHLDFYVSKEEEKSKKLGLIYEVVHKAADEELGQDKQNQQEQQDQQNQPNHHPTSCRLTITEKKRILLENIYGLDIDTQAVEVAKLSLLLKCLEGETDETIEKKRLLIHDRVLPDLYHNIRCGNALVGSDFYNQGMLGFSEEERYQINVFDWSDEEHGFGKIVGKLEQSEQSEQLEQSEQSGQFEKSEQFEKSGQPEQSGKIPTPATNSPAKIKTSPTSSGFDVIIGNPPYARIQSLTASQHKDVLAYFKDHYLAGKRGNFDIYGLFIERGYNLLNANGVLGFICPHKFFNADFGEHLRNYLAEKKALSQVVHFGDHLIFSVGTSTCLLFLSKVGCDHLQFTRVDENPKGALARMNDDENGDENDEDKSQSDGVAGVDEDEKKFAYQTFSARQPSADTKWAFVPLEKQALLDKIGKNPLKLADVCRKIFQGISTSSNEIYVLEVKAESEETYLVHSKILDREVELEKEMVKPFLMGRDIKKYTAPLARNVVLFPYHLQEGKATLMEQDTIKQNYPLAWEYLQENKKALEGRERGRMKGKNFYAYIYPKNLIEFEAPRIMTAQFCGDTTMALDERGIFYHTDVIYSFVFNEHCPFEHKAMLGILNSKLMWFFMHSTSTSMVGSRSVRFTADYLKPFPLPDAVAKSDERALVELVDHMLQLRKQEVGAPTSIFAALNTGAREHSPHSKSSLRRDIKAANDHINALVYKMYHLTDPEIKIVEQTPIAWSRD